MRISLLLKREPFGEIIKKTLSRFFRSKYNKEYIIRWSVANKLEKPRGNSDIWLCNPFLNVIFTPTTLKENFDPILREFSYSTVPWRRPLQRLYCFFAIHPLTTRYFSRYRLSISPQIPQADNLIMIGGNHRVRLLDRKQKKCYVINKFMFDSSRTRQEIIFRQSDSILPIPEILEIAPDQTWYEEKYVAGTPVNRLSNKYSAEEAEAKAIACIRLLAEKTARQESLREYSKNLSRRILERTKKSSLLTSKQKQHLDNHCGMLLKLLLDIKKSEIATITSAQTHGDFQPGNILVDKDTVWIIDWEYTRRRQSGYEALVYRLRSRFGDVFYTELQKTVKGERDGVLEDWPGLSWRKPKRRLIALALFLLEELDLYLEENDNTLFTQLSGGMMSFLTNFEKYVETLSKEYAFDARQ